MSATPWPPPQASSTPIGLRPHGPPRPLTGDVRVRTRRRADGAAVSAALVGGIAVDVATRTGAATLGAALAVATVVTAAFASRRILGQQAMVLALGAPVLATFLVVRSSPWLVALDLVAIVGLLGLSASLSAGGSLWDLSVPRTVGRGFVVACHVVCAPGFVLGALAERRVPSAWKPVARGLGLAAPVLLVLIALLSSADAVFASFLSLPDLGSLPGHVLAITAGAWLTAGLVRAADGEHPEPFPARGLGLGRVEAGVVLGGVAVVLGGFALAQVVATTTFGGRVLREAGLTYADHARSGFFQLLAVAALTLALLLAVRATTGHVPVLAGLGVAVCALTLVVVWVSISRLGAYEAAYGLTMLRLASTWSAWWIGALFLVVAVRLAGAAVERHWLVGAAGALALVWLIAWNLADPESVVARHDLRRSDVDLTYVTGLSDDAVPTVVAALPALEPARRALVLERLCARDRAETEGLSWNTSRSAAREALATVCPPAP